MVKWVLLTQKELRQNWPQSAPRPFSAGGVFLLSPSFLPSVSLALSLSISTSLFLLSPLLFHPSTPSFLHSLSLSPSSSTKVKNSLRKRRKTSKNAKMALFEVALLLMKYSKKKRRREERSEEERGEERRERGFIFSSHGRTRIVALNRRERERRRGGDFSRVTPKDPLSSPFFSSLPPFPLPLSTLSFLLRGTFLA
jgi:hypothetical protein